MVQSAFSRRCRGCGAGGVGSCRGVGAGEGGDGAGDRVLRACRSGHVGMALGSDTDLELS